MTQPLAAEKKAGAEYEQLKETISSLPSKVVQRASMAGHDEHLSDIEYGSVPKSCFAVKSFFLPMFASACA